MLLHSFQQASQCVKVYWVGIDVKQCAVAVDEFVGGVAIHADMVFYGTLLLVGQVVVNHIFIYY